jgi:hypothetical protein
MSWDSELHAGVLEIQPTEVLSVNTARTAGRPAVTHSLFNGACFSDNISPSCLRAVGGALNPDRVLPRAREQRCHCVCWGPATRVVCAAIAPLRWPLVC